MSRLLLFVLDDVVVVNRLVDERAIAILDCSVVSWLCN